MAATKPISLPGLNPENKNSCTIEATVVTGLETVAALEVNDKLGADSVVERGRIIFDYHVNKVHEVLQLKSVDSVYVLVGDFGDFEFSSEKELALEKIGDIVDCLDWVKGLSVWKGIFGCKTSIPKFEHLFSSEATIEESAVVNPIDMSYIGSNMQQIALENANSSSEITKSSSRSQGSSEKPKAEGSNECNFKFRVTCNRAGKSHSFGSPDAAGKLGAAIIDKFGWKADMTKFDAEVVLNISDNHMYAGISLTQHSLHKRNIEHFGPTTLRSTIAYNMLRLGGIADGEVVCDPMCGGGSIPIEGAMNWPNSYHICGDVHELAWSRTKLNLDAINRKITACGRKQLKIDIFKWDTCCLPLRDNFVDIFVTDLPFGKRSGTKSDNRTLYPRALRELGRVSKIGTGRMILLTQDKKNMIQTLQRLSRIWKNPRTYNMNMGGLAGAIFVLTRTAFPIVF